MSLFRHNVQVVMCVQRRSKSVSTSTQSDRSLIFYLKKRWTLATVPIAHDFPIFAGNHMSYACDMDAKATRSPCAGDENSLVITTVPIERPSNTQHTMGAHANLYPFLDIAQIHLTFFNWEFQGLELSPRGFSS